MIFYDIFNQPPMFSFIWVVYTCPIIVITYIKNIIM